MAPQSSPSKSEAPDTLLQERVLDRILRGCTALNDLAYLQIWDKQDLCVIIKRMRVLFEVFILVVLESNRSQ